LDLPYLPEFNAPKIFLEKHLFHMDKFYKVNWILSKYMKQLPIHYKFV
jgi:hypothetical protein